MFLCFVKEINCSPAWPSSRDVISALHEHGNGSTLCDDCADARLAHLATFAGFIDGLQEVLPWAKQGLLSLQTLSMQVANLNILVSEGLHANLPPHQISFILLLLKQTNTATITAGAEYLALVRQLSNLCAVDTIGLPLDQIMEQVTENAMVIWVEAFEGIYI